MNLEKAVDYMKSKHEGQKRKNGSDYFYHPLRVAQAKRSKTPTALIILPRP